MKKIFANRYIHYSLFVLAGLFIGWLFFHSSNKMDEKHEHNSEESVATIWTCAMHPQIRMHEAGKCPICGMDLIPLKQNDSPIDQSAIKLSKEAMELANVLTSVATRQKPIKELRLYGKVQADERLLQSQVAHIPGRIEKLLVNFTGESISKGQTLALIYSPELITAQQELIEAAKTKQLQPEIYEAAKEKLNYWKLTESQISSIENSGNVKNTFEVVSNTTGIVTSRRVNNGDYISQGAILYDIVDLTRVWVMFDAYESDLQFLNIGNKISFTIQALPGINFVGNIIFIDPVIDPNTRVSKVRVEINNQLGKLKPEMFATGIVNANLSEFQNNIIIPRSAVLWTGKRSIVYVKQTGTDEGIFKMREVELGPMLGNSYVIINGLKEGEEIVTQGTFSVDASAQLEGKPSMMNPEGSIISKTHDHGNLKMEQSDEQKENLTNKTNIKHEMFIVYGNCEMCKERIEKATLSLNGVNSAEWNIETKMIHVSFDVNTIKMNDIHKAIAKVGHDTELEKASDDVYNALPECCLYRNSK